MTQDDINGAAKAAPQDWRFVFRKQRRAIATAASVVVHLLLVLALLPSTSGTTLAGTDDPGEGDIEVTLVSLAGLKGGQSAAVASSAEPQEPADLASMFKRLRPDSSDYHQAGRSAPKPDAADLLDAIDRQRANARETRSAEQAEAGNGGATDVKGSGQARQADAQPTADRNAKSGMAGLPSEALLAQVERCWKRLPRAASTSVSLQITLDDRGRLAVPPKIMRVDGAALNERRLGAEARMLQALAACAPYRPAAPPGKQRTYQLDFGRPGKN